MKGRTIVMLGTVCFIILLSLILIGVGIFYSRCQFPSVILLLMAALAGFYFAMSLSFFPFISRVFAYVGKYSMSILIFHFLSYDVIDALRVMIGGMSWECVSAFPLLATGWSWGVCYVIAGVGLPIILNLAWQRVYCFLGLYCKNK